MNETLNKGSDNLTNQNRNTEKVANIRWGIFFVVIVIPSSVFLGIVISHGIKVLMVTMFLIFVVHMFQKLTDRYNIRPIREEEKALFLEKKIIHYTDKSFLEEDEQCYPLTGKFKLVGNNSPVSNYRLRYKDKCRKFVWFHLEDQPDEPYFRGFMETHGLATSPRKYKVVTNFRDLQNSNIYINPTNNYILVEGDVEVNGRLYTQFNWYDNKVYYFFMIKYSLAWILVFWLDAIQKLVIGTYLEKRIKTKQ